MDAQQAAESAQKPTTGTTPVGFTKPKKFLFFKIRSKPIYESKPQPAQAPKPAAPVPPAPAAKPAAPPRHLFQPKPQAPKAPAPIPTPTPLKAPAAVEKKGLAQGVKPEAKKSKYITKYITNKKGLDEALRDIGLKTTPYDFIKRMIIYAVIVSAALGFIVLYAFYQLLGLSLPLSIIFGVVCAVAFYNALFNKFASYPLARGRQIGKQIEKDILFATRDLVISMRSGMPLFNAMTSVSNGYGAASAEFAKIVSLIQLGSPIEAAIDEVSEKSKSRTFKRIMLQASVSIRVGADVTGSLQSVVDDIMQERVIELRRYGQKLNALAMFYMLFGVIFPSMGVAIAVIMSTFISLFTVDATTLAFVIVAIIGLQVIFLNLIKSSRPTFSA